MGHACVERRLEGDVDGVLRVNCGSVDAEGLLVPATPLRF